jgi:hypothetical protein
MPATVNSTLATLEHIKDFEEGLVKSEAFYYAL